MISSAANRQAPAQDADWNTFVRRLRAHAGIDLECYKPEQMRRRLSSLMSRCQATSFSDYAQVLERDAARLREFRDFFTINVSEFFRNPEKFEQLRREILPALLAKRPRLRIWSAACSYGAEPFSVAMMLAELTPGIRHSILGTDVDESILERARAADSFTAQDLQNVPDIYRRRHFTPSQSQPGRFALAPAIRQLVDFRQHDLLKAPYLRDYDLIICRNVVIYFTDEAKHSLYTRFHESLRPGGFLFVGGTEMVDRATAIGFQSVLLSFYKKLPEVAGHGR